MSFNHLFMYCFLILLPLMARGQRSIEEFNWKKHSGWAPLTRIADHQLPPLIHSPSMQCILKCISQISCAAVCIHSESRCRLYRCADCAGGDETVAKFAEQTAICFVNIGSDKYQYGKTGKKNSTVGQTAVRKDLIESSVTQSVTQASLSANITQTSSEQDKDNMDAEIAAKCNQGWKMFDTRRGIIKCRPILSSHPILPTIGKEREVGMTRIVMFPRKNRLLRQQLYTDNNSVVEYPFLRNINIQAVAYISFQRKLIVSSFHPDLLFFTPIDNKQKTVIKTRTQTRAIAIDEHKQLIFMKMVTPKPCVCVMSTDGKNITSLFSLVIKCAVNFPGGLIADHKRSLIYVLCPNDKILQFTYQGVSKGKLVDRPGRWYGFCLDTQGDVLFYMDRKGYLHKLSLSDHSVTTTHTLKGGFTMLTVGNILYMNLGSVDHLLVVNTNDMATTTKINIGYKGRIVMCLIP